MILFLILCFIKCRYEIMYIFGEKVKFLKFYVSYKSSSYFSVHMTMYLKLFFVFKCWRVNQQYCIYNSGMSTHFLPNLSNFSHVLLLSYAIKNSNKNNYMLLFKNSILYLFNIFNIDNSMQKYTQVLAKFFKVAV